MDWYSWLSRTNLEPALTYEYGLSFTRNELQKEDLGYFNHEFLLSLGINVARHRLEILKLARKELGGTSSTINNGLSKLVLATKKLFTKKNNKNSPPLSIDMSAYQNRNQWSGALKRLSSNSNSKEQKKQEKKTIIMTPPPPLSSRKKNVMRSGPLDRRTQQMQDRGAITNKCLSVSGPLDGTSIPEKWMAVNWSPIRAVPIDGKWRSEKSSYGYGIGIGSRSPSNYNYSPWEGRTSPNLSPSPLSYHHQHYYHQANVGGEIDEEGAQSLWALMFQDLKPT